jgi:HD-like signal output (HDOD) protein
MSIKKPADTAAPAAAPRKRIGQLLVEHRLVSPKQLDHALQVQAEHGGKIVENLIKLNYLNIRTFVNFVSKQPGIASIDLSHYDVPKNLVSLIPRAFATKHEVFPIDRLGKLLTVGMVCPLDRETLDELEQITGLRVKALLCSADDIHATIRLYYPSEHHSAAASDGFQQLGSALKIEHVASLIREIDALPALPDTVRRVRELMEDPDVPTGEVAKVISMDPPVCAHVLRLANSAAYGFPRKVDNIDLAVSLLGLQEIYMVVLSSAVVDLYKDSSAFDYDAFWKASLFCAIAAREIARATASESRAGTFAQGLLADIGRLVFMEVATERYAAIPRTLPDAELLVAEDKEFGLAHPEAGYLLATHWGLPEELACTIRFHHAPHLAQEDLPAAWVIALAAKMAEFRRVQSDQPDFAAEDHLLAPLRLQPSQAQQIFDRTVTLATTEAP